MNKNQRQRCGSPGRLGAARRCEEIAHWGEERWRTRVCSPELSREDGRESERETLRKTKEQEGRNVYICMRDTQIRKGIAERRTKT